MSRYVRWEGAGPLAWVWLDVERAVKIKDEAGNIIEPDDELEETGSCGADLCEPLRQHDHSLYLMRILHFKLTRRVPLPHLDKRDKATCNVQFMIIFL